MTADGVSEAPRKCNDVLMEFLAASCSTQQLEFGQLQHTHQLVHLLVHDVQRQAFCLGKDLPLEVLQDATTIVCVSRIMCVGLDVSPLLRCALAVLCGAEPDCGSLLQARPGTAAHGEHQIRRRKADRSMNAQA